MLKIDFQRAFAKALAYVARLKSGADPDQAEELDRLLKLDDETCLLNKKFFKIEVERILEKIRDNPDQHAYLILLDGDGLKRINDRLGHPAGDEAIRSLGRFIGRITRRLPSERHPDRDPDIVARIGGDEFAVLTMKTDREKAELAAKRIVRALKDHMFEWEGRMYPLPAAAGFIELTKNMDFDQAYKLADRELYKNKGPRWYSIAQSCPVVFGGYDYRF